MTNAQARRSIERYNTAKDRAESNWDFYTKTGQAFNLQVANDWVDAANRAVETAAGFGITLEVVQRYEAN